MCPGTVPRANRPKWKLLAELGDRRLHTPGAQRGVVLIAGGTTVRGQIMPRARPPDPFLTEESIGLPGAVGAASCHGNRCSHRHRGSR